jgi:hypothetical protein
MWRVLDALHSALAHGSVAAQAHRPTAEPRTPRGGRGRVGDGQRGRQPRTVLRARRSLCSARAAVKRTRARLARGIALRTHLWGGGSEVEDCGREEEHEGDAAPRHLRKEGALKPRQALHDEWLVSRLSPVPGGASTSRARAGFSYRLLGSRVVVLGVSSARRAAAGIRGPAERAFFLRPCTGPRTPALGCLPSTPSTM